MSRIDAKVAKVLDDQSIAINVGIQDDVAEGDRVVLLERVEVTDPDEPTRVLGEVLVERGELRVSSVMEEFSVARVIRVSALATPGVPFFAPPRPQFKIVHGGAEEEPGKVKVNPKDPVYVFTQDDA